MTVFPASYAILGTLSDTVTRGGAVENSRVPRIIDLVAALRGATLIPRGTGLSTVPITVPFHFYYKTSIKETMYS